MVLNEICHINLLKTPLLETYLASAIPVEDQYVITYGIGYIHT